jgi:glycosyltransferase involved in cell wall biosynthesis
MNNKNNIRILFISHDATRTGAPIIFYNLIKWLKVNTSISFEILLKNGGEMEADFKNLGPTWLINYRPLNKPTLKERIFSRTKPESNNRLLRMEELIDRLANQFQPNLIYSNTITNGEILNQLSSIKCPVITHVHELDFWIREKVGNARFKLVDQSTDIFITVSEAVSQNLIENWGINPSRIKMIHGFIPVTPDPSLISTYRKEEIRRELGIPIDAFVVGGSGTTDWRKAPEHFINLAFNIIQRNPKRPVHFLWVGGQKEGIEVSALKHELKLTGLLDQVHFVGTKINPLDYYSAFDLFAMVSREDPFPLVNLETASLGKPIVCFDRSGGSSEFVESDCGKILPYLDFNAMADWICELLDDPNQFKTLGNQARKKVLERHSIDVQGPKIASLIKQVSS